MYKLTIEQSYNRVEFEFGSAKEAIEFFDSAANHSAKKTTFTLEMVEGSEEE